MYDKFLLKMLWYAVSIAQYIFCEKWAKYVHIGMIYVLLNYNFLIY